MEPETILYRKKNQVAVIRLNRPKVLNAMNKQLWIDLSTALVDAQEDDTVRAVIVTGEGRAFSTGADLKDAKDRSLQDYRIYLEHLQKTSLQIIRFEKPLIAAINGYALGSGYELALACDIRIAAKEAKIGFPEAKVTSSVTGGAFRLLPDLVGPGKAAELLFTAQYVDGAEAARIGLVNDAVEADQLMESAMQMAEQIAQNAPFAVKMIKKGLRTAQGEASLATIMDFEVEGCLACVSTKERQVSLDQFAARKE